MAQSHHCDRQLLPRLPGIPETSSTVMTGRRPKTRTKTAEEWEAYRITITKLYDEEDLTLEAVMSLLDKEHGFQAS